MKLHPASVAALMLLAGSASASPSVHEAHPRADEIEAEVEDVDELDEPSTLSGATNFTASSMDSLSGSVVGIDSEGGVITSSTLRRRLEENPLDLFKPLTCNTNIESVACESWDTLTITAGQPVVIPCGKCITVDVADGTELDLADGLDIQGKLVFPDNKKVTVRTTHVYLQGVLKIRDTNVISPENESVKFHFYGTGAKSFVPHVNNSIGCPTGSCDAGIKPFLIAGGKLDVMAWSDPTCPTWTRIQDIVYDDFASLATDGTDFALPASAPGGCDRAITDTTFDTSNNHGWRSHLGCIDEIATDGTHSCFKVHNRTQSWQGPYLDLSDRKHCIQSDQDYTFSARIRLSKEDGSGTPTQCSSTGTNCPSLVVRRRQAGGYIDAPVEKVWLMKEDGMKTTDGQWFDLYGKFDFTSGQADPTNVYLTLTIEGPEPGVVIEVDSLYVGLPPDDQYPSATNAAEVCNDLFIADPSADGYIGNHAPKYPYPLYINSGKGRFLRVLSETDANTGQPNNFYRITDRVQEYESLAIPLPPGCTRGGARYDISFRARLHDDGHFENVKAQFVAGSKYLSSRACTNTFGGNRGWVECSVTIVLDDVVSDPNNGSPYFRINTGFPTGGGTTDVTLSVDYDDISIKLVHPSIKALVVEEEVANCWGEGSDVVVSSITNDWDDEYSGRKVVSATKLNDGSGMAHLALDKFIARPTSVADNPNQATEVALHTRNVVFYSEEEVSNVGAYMTVKHTSGVPQVLSGVKIDQFGQWNEADRYSFHFDRCDNVEGSVVSKNLITRAGYNGVVLQGTHNVTVSQNVVYNSRGSSFMLRDGKEWDNKIEFNMAARNQNPGNKDYSGFLIRSVRGNRINNNVAAGASDRGFYFHLENSVRSASTTLPGGNPKPRYEDGLEISDNVAHSCNGYGLVISRWLAENSVPFQGFKSYRNEGTSAYAYGRYIKFTNAYIADFRVKGMDFERCDNCELTDSEVVGATALAVDAVWAEGDEWHQCLHAPSSDYKMVGIELEHYRDSSGHWYPGVQFNNVKFSGFNDTKCVRPTTISFDSGGSRLPHFNLLATLSGSRNVDGGDFLVDFCRIEDWDVQDVIFHDLDSGLHPDGAGSYVGTSALVSDHAWMKGFAGGQCRPIDGRCAAYCEGLCLRYHTFKVTSYETEDVTLKVKDLATNKTIEIGGNFYHERNYDSSTAGDGTPKIYNNNYYSDLRIFSVPLPDSTFEAQFMKNGQPYWPTFVERGDPEPAPACWRGGGDEDTALASVTFLPPSPVCSELVKNGDGEMEGGNYTHWYHASGGVLAIAGAGVNGSTALVSGVPHNTTLPSGVQDGDKQRDDFYDGLAFYVDTRCTKAIVGQEYELTAMMKLEDSNGLPWSCNPGLTNDDYDGCPRFSATVKIWDDASSSYKYSNWYKIATVTSPYNDAGYTLVHGTFVIPQDFAAADSVRFTFSRTNPTAKIYLDDVSIHPLQSAARNSMGSVNGELVVNGDFEEAQPPSTKYWIKRQDHDGSIEVVNPGADGSATAVKVTGRTSPYQGPGQFLNPGTFVAGQEYEISTKFRLSNGGTLFTCDANLGYTQALSCPLITIKSTVGTLASSSSSYPKVAHVADPGAEGTDYWGVIHGKFFPDDNMLNAFRMFVYVEYPGVGVDIEIDDFSIKAYTLDCTNVVKNGNFETADYRSWLNHESTTLSMVTPGASGTPYALKLSGRAGMSYGAQQKLEKDCLAPNNQYLLEARFRLENTDGSNYTCNQNVIESCPIASLVSEQDNVGMRDRIVAAAVGGADGQGWHDMRGIFELYESDFASDSVYLRFKNAPADVDIIIDEVVMTKIENPLGV